MSATQWNEALPRLADFPLVDRTLQLFQGMAMNELRAAFEVPSVRACVTGSPL